MAAATARSLQTAIATLYTTITLPGGLGAPAGLTDEPDGGLSSLPAVVVHRGPTLSIARVTATSYRVQREFAARLYVAKFTSDTPSAISASKNLAIDCVEAVEDAFMFLGNTLKNTAFVEQSVVLADTGDGTLIDLNNDTYTGVLFRHRITYIRAKSAS